MNGIAKSQAQEILSVVIETLADAYALLRLVGSERVIIKSDDYGRDVSYLTKRFHSEGVTFFTKQLPLLGDWFDEWVAGSEVERVVGFKPYDGLFPCFMRPFWVYLSYLRDDPDSYSDDPATYHIVRLVRTLLLGLKKLEVPFDQDQKDEKLESFLSIEDELKTFPLYPTGILQRAQLLLDDFLAGYFPTCQRPKHGPGAVAGREKHNAKWNFSTLYESLHAEFPYYEYIFGVRSSVYDEFTRRVRSLPLQLAHKSTSYFSMKREKSPVARLLFVPKDSRGPRIISCEPKELMYMQQGVAKHLMDYIECHNYTKGHVNFLDQSVNAELALKASAFNQYATIDLSDASDRVSCKLISLLYPSRIVKKWFALRSTATLLPNGNVVELEKFAPMGSALCFPVESLTFWALAVACAMEHGFDQDLACSMVWVYGDDIIIANELYDTVVKAFSDLHLVVNKKKSFHGSHPFRESCGIDALRGHLVTPLRVKKLPPQRPSDGQAIVAYVKYAENSACLSPRRSQRLLELCERLVGRIPRTPVPQMFLSVVDPENFWSHHDYRKLEWDPAWCYFSTKLLVVFNKSITSAIDSWSRLQLDLTTPVEHDPSLVVDRSSTIIRRKRVFVTYLDVSNG